MRTITLSENGRITLPAPVRHALGLEGESELTVEIDTDTLYMEQRDFQLAEKYNGRYTSLAMSSGCSTNGVHFRLREDLRE